VGGRGSGSGATGAEPQKLQSPAAEQGSSRRRLPPCRELAPPSVAAWLECWLLPQDRVCSVPWGVFVTLYRAGPSNVIRPGLGWPASPAATNRVCVHVRNEPGLVQMLFATPSFTCHHVKFSCLAPRACHEQPSPEKMNSSAVSREPGGAITFAHRRPCS
jgi:hypothetical protein